MRKRNFAAALLCSLCLVAAGASPAMADSMKVVTLGADLSQDQKDLMMRYFKVSSNEVQILSITNEDEREHLSGYVPLEQIGTRTVSCAFVKPTQSGGIKVRTANLNWVTCNMIASTLSTSGVTNCEVVAACPFEVSGTGALTGIIMAYETASGEKLDETKKELATEELVVTGNLAEEVGQDDATSIINQAKMEIISSNIQDADQIYNVVVNIAEQNNMQIDGEQLDVIVSLLEEIAKQNYDYEQMKQTLENVEQNVSGEQPAEPDASEDEIPVVEDDGESIIADLDESILGDNVIAGSTEDPSLQEETMGSSDSSDDLENWEMVDDEALLGNEDDGMIEEEWGGDASGDDEWIQDDGWDEDEWSGDGSEGDEWNEDASGEEQGDGDTSEGEETPAADPLDTEDLSDTAKALVEDAKSFCAGEFQEDTEAAQYAVKSEGPAAFVTLDAETGEGVTEKVLAAFIEVLRDGGASYVPSDSDDYITPELNMIAESMKKVFVLTDDAADEEGLWTDVSEESRLALYDDTMRFFQEMYGETAGADDETGESYEGDDASYDETETSYDGSEGGEGYEEGVPQE